MIYQDIADLVSCYGLIDHPIPEIEALEVRVVLLQRGVRGREANDERDEEGLDAVALFDGQRLPAVSVCA